MNEVLMMLGMYKPQMSANGICCDSVIQELVSRGYSVRCVINDSIKDHSDYIDDMRVYRVKPRAVYRIKQWCDNRKRTKMVSLILSLNSLLTKLKLILAIPSWPLISILYTYRFYHQACMAYKERKFDIIIGVYTPFDSVFAAHLIKKRFRDIKYYPYFLDSFSGGYGPRCFSKEYQIKRSIKWERKIVSNADKVIAMEASKNHMQTYCYEWIYKTCFLDIPLFRSTAVRQCGEGLIKLVYSGTIVKNIRDPQPLIDILYQLNRLDISITFIGYIDCMDLFDRIKLLYGSRLAFLGTIPHDNACEVMEDADILINIGNSNNNMIPSKIFEYMSMGKPIISTFKNEHDPCLTYLEKYNIALCIDEKIVSESVIDMINKFISSSRDMHINTKELEKIFYQNTPRAFVDVIST